MKVLLLNPPAESLYLRDMYSSTKSKWGYSWPPADLLMLSGILKPKHKVQFLDANIMNLNFEETLEKIGDDINAVFFVTGSSCLENDMGFIAALKNKISGVKTIGSAGCFLHNPVYFMKKYPYLDAILLNFISDDILKYLAGEFEFNNIVYRGSNNQITIAKSVLPNSPFKLNTVPSHELLPFELYNLPHGLRRPLTSVMASYGCPYHCAYCVAQNVNYVHRDVEDIMEELRFIKTLGIKEVIFRDNTFGADKKRAMELCIKIVDENIDLTWVCDSRVNTMNDENLLRAMKRAGCHTIHFGLESGDPKILEKYGKGITHEEMFKTFHLCKKIGIKTLGYFIIGLPEETKESIMKTVELAKELDCDYASFNLPIPIYGTKLREEAIKNKWIKGDDAEIFDGSYFPVIETPQLSARDLWELRNLAIKKFYLRPKFIFKKLLNIRNVRDLRVLFDNFKSFLSNFKKNS